MSRLIIENRSRKSDAEALEYAARVVGGGRISDSGLSYCHVTTFRTGVVVAAYRNKSSDRLVILDEKAA